MDCPLCGDPCRCSRSLTGSADEGAQSEGGRVLADLEEFDASEQQFAASLENFTTASASTTEFKTKRFTTERLAPEFTTERLTPERLTPEFATEKFTPEFTTRKFTTKELTPKKLTTMKFEVERTMEPAIDSSPNSISARAPQTSLLPTGSDESRSDESGTNVAGESGSAFASGTELVSLPESASPDEWREEVAATMHRYRARGKARPPRYPSLMLNFDPPEQLRSSSSNSEAHTSVASSTATSPRAAAFSEPAASLGPRLAEDANVQAEPIGKILEFPRPVAAPPDELAEPVQSRPRIMEAQEAVPPPPALGGIVMEEREPAETPAHLNFDVPVQVASPWRRALAAALDIFLVGAAFAIFAAIAWRFTGAIPPRPQLIAAAAGVLAVLWSCYQYLLVVSTGNTPGLRMMKLRLLHLNGTPVSRQMRRCRVLASLLSAASLGLGYLWCFLDEDRLCWHDRITHSYLTRR